MTETEKKALTLLDAVAKERGGADGWGFVNREDIRSEALCRALEQHEAFRQEVSDAVEEVTQRQGKLQSLLRFIIAKPDPLVEVISEVRVSPRLRSDQEMADEFRAAIEARGGRIVWEGE